MLRTTVDHRNMHFTDVTCSYDCKMFITTITHSLRLQWECYLTSRPTESGRKWPWETVGMERAAKCKHDVLVTSPPMSFTHFRHRPPARRRTKHAADHTQALSNSRLAAVYLWLAIAKAVSHCPGWLKLFDAAKTRGTHTHIMVASSSFSCLSITKSGETWRVTN